MQLITNILPFCLLHCFRFSPCSGGNLQQRRLFYFLLLCLVPAWGFGQVSVETSLDSSSIQLGSVATLRIRVLAEGDTPAPQADFRSLDTMSRVEVLETKPFRSVEAPGGQNWEAEVQLIGLEPGLQEIAGIRIFFPDTILAATPITLEVLVPALPPEAGLAPIKDIVKEPLRFSDRWPIGLPGLLLLLAAVAWFLYRARRTRPALVAASPAEEQIPTHVVALRKLEALKQNQLWKQSHKNHYIELTDILRAYIGERFLFRALSETSSDILHDLASSKIAPAALQRLEGILHTADLVKFAKARPDEALSVQLLDDAFCFVEETMPFQSPSTIAP